MEEIIQFLDFLTPYGTYSYVVIFGVLIACGFGFPMPEDIILISGGILSARGVCDIWMVNAVAFAGVLFGDGAMFSFGKILGPKVKSTWLFRRLLSDHLDEKIRGIFQKYGDKVVFIARFLPGLRSPIFVTAGIYKLSYWKFLLLDGLAALISVPVWIYAGHLFGDNLERLEQVLHKFQAAVIVGAVLLVFGIYAIYWLKNRLINQQMAVPVGKKTDSSQK